MAELARRGAERAVGAAPPDLALDVPGAVRRQRRIGRRLLGPLGADVHVVAVGVADPQPAVGRATRRVDLGHPRLPERLAHGLELTAGRAERQVMEALPGPAVEQRALPADAARMEVHRVVPRGPVHEAERTVEGLADRLVRHLESVVEQSSNGHGRIPLGYPTPSSCGLAVTRRARRNRSDDTQPRARRKAPPRRTGPPRVTILPRSARLCTR